MIFIRVKLTDSDGDVVEDQRQVRSVSETDSSQLDLPPVRPGRPRSVAGRDEDSGSVDRANISILHMNQRVARRNMLSDEMMRVRKSRNLPDCKIDNRLFSIFSTRSTCTKISRKY